MPEPNRNLSACNALHVALAEQLGAPLLTAPARLARAPGLRCPVKEVEVRACGQERILAPIGRGWDCFFLDGPTVSDDFLVDRGSWEHSERDAF